jgi:hypothetical protein
MRFTETVLVDTSPKIQRLHPKFNNIPAGSANSRAASGVESLHRQRYTHLNVLRLSFLSSLIVRGTMNQLLSKKLVKSLSVGVFLICWSSVAPAEAAEGITGYWDIKIRFGEREMTSKLRIFKNDDGQLAGTWTSRRSRSKLSDVRFEEGKLTFTRKSTYRDRQWVSTYEGTLSGDTLTGVIKSERGQATANGKRGGPDLTGNWELTSTSQRGTRTRLLTIKDDKTATMRFGDDDIAVKDLRIEGELLSLKVELSFGEQSFTMEFKGKLQGEVLEGEFVTSRGSRKVTGKRVTGQAPGSAQSSPALGDPSKPARTEVITPIRNETFDRNGTTKQRKQGGNPRKVAGYLAFDGSMDGNRQVDPQIAVGGQRRHRSETVLRCAQSGLRF